jgi:uncharacterized protein (TIGR02301 family)
MRARVLALAAAVALPAAALSQQRPRSEPPPPPPPPPERPAPYEPQLLRLSEVMGILTFMNTLCRTADGEQWRRRMVTLLETEGQASGRKERLAGAYNRGYQTYQYAYNSCTPNARLVIERSLDEGERLTRELTTRFSG